MKLLIGVVLLSVIAVISCQLTPPNSEQFQCVAREATRLSQQEAEQYVEDCSDTSIYSSVSRFCGSACFNIARNIYKTCGYTAACGGSVRVYAVPVLVLISALLSILF